MAALISSPISSVSLQVVFSPSGSIVDPCTGAWLGRAPCSREPRQVAGTHPPAQRRCSEEGPSVCSAHRR